MSAHLARVISPLWAVSLRMGFAGIALFLLYPRKVVTSTKGIWMGSLVGPYYKRCFCPHDLRPETKHGEQTGLSHRKLRHHRPLSCLGRLPQKTTDVRVFGSRFIHFRTAGDGLHPR